MVIFFGNVFVVDILDTLLASSWVPLKTTHIKYICTKCMKKTDIEISPKIYVCECFDKLGNLIKQVEV